MTLRDGVRYSHELLRNRGTLVRPELLAQLDLQRRRRSAHRHADRSRFAASSHRSRDGAWASFTLGPRIFIDHADLREHGPHHVRRRGPTTRCCCACRTSRSTTLNRDLNAAFVNEFVSVRTYKRSQDRMGDNLTRTENYLSLVGLVVLILGGIGVSSVTRVFVQQKVRSIAILKCVGTTSRQVLAVYMTQVLLLGLAGSLLGVAIAADGDGGHSGARRRARADAAGRIRPDGGRGRAGPGRRAPGVAAVLARAAARGAARQAVAASSPGHSAADERRLAEVGRDGRRGRRARRRCVVAGGLARGRPVAVRRVRGHCVRAAPGRHRARPRRAAAALRALVRAAAGGAAHRAARQPDTRHPACRRTGHVLHPRCPDPAGEPAPRFRHPGGRGLLRTCSSWTSSPISAKA